MNICASDGFPYPLFHDLLQVIIYCSRNIGDICNSLD